MSGIVPWANSMYVLPPTAPPQPTTPQLSLREWWSELQRDAPPKPARVESAVVGLRQNGESAIMGALLALVDTELGGLDLGGRIPLDWMGAAVFYALSVRDATTDNSGLASDFRSMGQACTTVATYRMTHRWREGKKAIPQNASCSDPVLKAGKAAF
jgi:hypothetical protein